MHEFSLASEVVRLALEHAEGARILKVVLSIGSLAGVEPGAIAFCFESLARDTLAEGALLVLEEVPGEALCRNCGSTFRLERLYEPCPGCDGHELEILRGREMSVKEMEVV